jgi:hypothetical protein
MKFSSPKGAHGTTATFGVFNRSSEKRIESSSSFKSVPIPMKREKAPSGFNIFRPWTLDKIQIARFFIFL